MVKPLLLDDVIKQRVEIIRRHRRVGKTHDPVEVTLSEHVAYLLHDLGEVLGVDLHTSHVHVVGVDLSNINDQCSAQLRRSVHQFRTGHLNRTRDA